MEYHATELTPCAKNILFEQNVNMKGQQTLLS